MRTKLKQNQNGEWGRILASVLTFQMIVSTLSPIYAATLAQQQDSRTPVRVVQAVIPPSTKSTVRSFHRVDLSAANLPQDATVALIRVYDSKNNEVYKKDRINISGQSLTHAIEKDLLDGESYTYKILLQTSLGVSKGNLQGGFSMAPIYKVNVTDLTKTSAKIAINLTKPQQGQSGRISKMKIEVDLLEIQANGAEKSLGKKSVMVETSATQNPAPFSYTNLKEGVTYTYKVTAVYDPAKDKPKIRSLDAKFTTPERPAVLITFPARPANAPNEVPTVNAGPFKVSGTLNENKGITKVELSVDGKDEILATQEVKGKNTFSFSGLNTSSFDSRISIHEVMVVAYGPSPYGVGERIVGSYVIPLKIKGSPVSGNGDPGIPSGGNGTPSGGNGGSPSGGNGGTPLTPPDWYSSHGGDTQNPAGAGNSNNTNQTGGMEPPVIGGPGTGIRVTTQTQPSSFLNPCVTFGAQSTQCLQYTKANEAAAKNGTTLNW